MNVSPDAYRDTGMRMLRTSDLTDDGVLAGDGGVFLDGPVPAAQVLETNDLLLSRAGTIGRAYLVPEEGAGSTFAGFLVRFRPTEETDPRFLQYSIRSKRVQDQIKADAVTSTIQNFNADRYANLEIAQVDPEEQRRIADFLDDRVARIDQIIVARRHQHGLLEEASRAVIDALLLGRRSTDVPSQASGWPPFGTTPSGWREGALRRLRCMVQTGPFGSQLHSDEYTANGWPVVNPASISEAGLRAVPGMAVDDETRSRLSRHVLQESDIVFGRRGEMGRACLVTHNEVGWVCGTGSLLVRLSDPLMLPRYLAALLGTDAVRFYFTQTSVGSTMENLNTDILLGVPLLMPPVDVQARLLDSVDAVRTRLQEHREGLEASIALLAGYKQSLITTAVTGGLDVTTAGRGTPG